MTISVQRSRKLISGSGWANPLTHDFPIENAADVAVFADNQKLTLGVHYTVGGVSNPAGYTITITTPGDWAPAVWVLDVLYPINQPSDVDQGGQFGARFEAALDRMARSDQVIWERALRSVAVNRTTPLDQEIELPPPVPGAAIGYDAGNNLVTLLPDDLGGLIEVSAFMAAFLSSADAAAALAALGIDGNFARLDTAQTWTAAQTYGTAGSAAAPSIKFAADSGIYASSGTNISFSLAGGHIGRFATDGVHVGKLSAGIATVGHSLLTSGLAQHVRSAAVALQVNRIGAAGAIAEFMTSGTVALQVNEVGIDVPINGSATNTNIRFGFGAGHGIYALANTNVSFAIGGVHVGRFSSTGLHVTKFSADISTVGHSLTNDGLIQSTRNNDIAAQFNRTGSGGRIAEFLDDGNAVVHVGTDGSVTATTFLGDIAVAQATTAQLNSASNAINTTGKFRGKLVFNTDTAKLVAANASGASGTWKNVGTGATEHSPS